MKKILIHSVVICFLFAFSACFVSGPPAFLPTVDGPESTDILQNLNGSIIMDRPVGGIIAIELPTLKEVILRKPTDKKDTAIGPVSCLSGPDNKGRIAFISEHYLKVKDMNTETEDNVFMRRWSYWPQYKENYGESFSLSSTGGLVAFISNYKGVQMKNPSALLEVGQLEIWNIDSKEKVQIDSIKLLDYGLHWFPDGKSLTFVQLKSRADLENKFLKSLEEDSTYQSYKNWNKIPVVCIFDLRTDSIKVIDIGVKPIVSPKGESILMRSTINQNYYKLYNVSRDTASSIRFPGQSYEVFAFIKADVILYRGYPTAGVDQKWRNTSTGGSIRMFSLKIAQLHTNKFVTILPSIDRWDKIDFGLGR